MPKRSLLLVDGDARSLRVLEVSLKKAGFTVTTASNGDDALAIVEASPPELIISNTALEGLDGFEFCQRLKDEDNLAAIPFIFLTDQHSIEHKIRGLELGVDEYLTKPIYIKEILTRVRILLQKRDRVSLEARKGDSTRFTGKLSDMGVVDLIQTIEVSSKSGVSHFTSRSGQRASLYFRSGRVIDAELGTLQGADAIYRLLTWSDGEFEVLFRSVRRRDVIALSSQALLMEGMRRLDEWGRLLEQLPPLASRFEVVYPELADRLAELPDELNEILRLFDGRRSLMDIIDQTPQGDLESIELIAKLFFEGLIVESELELPSAEPWPGEGEEDPIELPPPARIRAATQDELEHELGDEVFDIELTEAVLENDSAPAGESASPPVRRSLIEAAIDAVAPIHPDLDALPGLGQDSGADDSDEPEGITGEQELGKLEPERRTLQMIPSLVEKVRHISDRIEQLAPEADEPDDLDRAVEAEVRAIESDVDAAMLELQSDFVTRRRGRRPVAEPPAAEAEADLSIPPAAVTLELEATLPPGSPAMAAVAASRPRLEVVPCPDEDELEDEEEGRAPDGAEPRLEVVDDDDAAEDVDVGTFDDAEPWRPGDSLPPAYHPVGPIDSPHIISSAGQEMATAAGAISSSPPVGIRGEGRRHSVVIDDDELRQPEEPDELTVDEPTVEEPLSGRNRRSSPPPIPAPPAVGRSPFPMIVGVMLTLALVAAIFLLRHRSERRAVPTGDDLAVHQEPAATPDAAVTQTIAPADAATEGFVEIVDAAPVLVDAAAVDPAVERRERAGDLVAQAQRARRQGQLQEALRLVQQAIELHESSRSLSVKASLMLRLKSREAAIRAADQAISLSARSSSAWLTKARAHYELAQYIDARAAFERYLVLRPTGKTADEVRIILESL